LTAQDTTITWGGCITNRYSDSEIWELMPNTDIGSTTTKQTIGAGISSTTGVSVNAEVSYSYSQSDVTVTNNSNIYSADGNWTFDYSGPDYGSVPFSKDAPPSVARSGSFSQSPVVIARVSSGSSLRFTVNPWFRNDYDSDVTYYFPASIKWTNSNDTASKSYTFTVSNSSCSD